MSPNTRRLASILGAALLLGVGGNLLFGASPAAVKPVAAAGSGVVKPNSNVARSAAEACAALARATAAVSTTMIRIPVF